MKYLVKELTKVPNGWTAYVHYYEGSCYCNHKKTDKLFIEQEQRPLRADWITAAGFL